MVRYFTLSSVSGFLKTKRSKYRETAICLALIPQWNAPCRILLRRGPTSSNFANTAEVALIHNLVQFQSNFLLLFRELLEVGMFQILLNSNYLAIRRPVSWHASGMHIPRYIKDRMQYLYRPTDKRP